VLDTVGWAMGRASCKKTTKYVNVGDLTEMAPFNTKHSQFEVFSMPMCKVESTAIKH